MRSTGEVMGIDTTSARRSPSRRPAVYGGLPTNGRAFVSVASRDKRSMVFPVKRLADLGFEICATAGTAEVLRRNGHQGDRRAQAPRGPRPGRRADHRAGILAGDVDLIVNTPYGVGRAARRLRDPHRRGGRGGPSSRPSRGWRRRCRASSRCSPADRRTVPPGTCSRPRRTAEAQDGRRMTTGGTSALGLRQRGGGAGQAGRPGRGGGHLAAARRGVLRDVAHGGRDPRPDPPGALPGCRLRWRRRRHAAAPRLLDLQRRVPGRLRRHRRHRVRGARQGHRVARPAPPPRHRRHRRSARQAVRAAAPAGLLRRSWRAATGPRRCSCSPTSCASAAAASTSCSAPRRRTSCSGCWTPSASRPR